MKTIIRKATKEDLKAIKEIEDESFLNPFKENDLLYEIEENPVSEFDVLVVDDEIVAYLDYWITFDSATIDKIAVKKNKRNQGFAEFLLKNAIENLKKQNVEFFTLEVRKSNLPALNLYEKYGFQKVTIKEKYYEDGEDAIYMVKGLI